MLTSFFSETLAGAEVIAEREKSFTLPVGGIRAFRRYFRHFTALSGKKQMMVERRGHRG